MSVYSWTAAALGCLLLLFTGSRTAASSASSQTKGNSTIWALIDLHTTVDHRGNCSKIDSVAMTAVRGALLWIQDTISNHSASSAPIGIRIFDTCGSSDKASAILLHAIAESSCMADVIGIISFTTTAVRSAIENVTNHLAIPHVIIWQEVTPPDPVPGQTVIIRLSSEEKARALLDIATALNWTYVTSLHTDSERALADVRSFSIASRNSSICISPSSRSVTNSGSEVALDAKALLLFLGETSLGLGTVRTLNNSTGYAVLVIGDGEPTRNASELRQGLLLTDSVPRLDAFEGYVGRLTTTTPGNELTSHASRIARALAQGLRVLFEKAGLDASQLLPLKLLNQTFYKETNVSEVYGPVHHLELFILNDKFIEKAGEYKDGSLHVLNQTLWRTAVMELSESRCSGMCAECLKCSDRSPLEEPRFFVEGDLYIGGVFPVETPPSCEWLHMATAFMYAIQTAKQRLGQERLWPGVKLGGIVVADGHRTAPRSTAEGRRCFTFTGKTRLRRYVPSDALLSWLSAADPSTPFADDREFPVSTFHVTGFRNSFLSDYYLEALASLLSGLDWSYVTLVYSDSARSRTALESFTKHARGKSVCVAGKLRLSATRTEEDVRRGVNSAWTAADQSRALVFLADEDHTRKFIQLFFTNETVKSFNFVLFPWNSNVEDLPKGERSGSVVSLGPTATSGLNVTDYLSSVGVGHPDLKQLLGDCSRSPSKSITTTAAGIVSTTDSIIRAADRVYREVCPGTEGPCQGLGERISRLISKSTDSSSGGGISVKDFEVSNLRLDGDKFYWEKVGRYVSGQLNLPPNSVKTYGDATESDAPASTCTGWCPVCYECPSPLYESRSGLYIGGDILIAAILPLRTTGSVSFPFSCGNLTVVTSDADQMVEALIYAVTSAKARYEKLLPGITPGLIVIDSCSSAQHAQQILGDFETCSVTFAAGKYSWSASPRIVPAYITFDSPDVENSVAAAAHQLRKPVLARNREFSGDGFVASMALSPEVRAGAIVDFLTSRKWMYVSVVASATADLKRLSMVFSKHAASRGVCVLSSLYIDDPKPLSDIISLTLRAERDTTVVIMFATERHLKRFLPLIKDYRLTKTWIFGISDFHWLSGKNSTIPAGSFLLKGLTDVYSGFRNYYVSRTLQNATSNPWFREFWQQRFQCRLSSNHFSSNCSGTESLGMVAVNPVTTDLIKAVDAVLFGLQLKFDSICKSKGSSCDAFAKLDRILDLESILDVSFEFENDSVRFTRSGELDTGVGIYSCQKIGSKKTPTLVKVASWKDGALKMESKVTIKAYDYNGVELSEVPTSACSRNCHCMNHAPSRTTSVTLNITSGNLLYLDHYSQTSGEFTGSIWATVVITVGIAGILTAIVLLFFFLYKVFSGTFVRRYAALGVLLLLAIVLLYASILPFIFTPTETICGLRYFAPGFSYAACLGTMLVKLMALREYQLVGLGGSVSTINQLLTVFFVVGVQVAVGAQWWVTKDPMLLTERTSTGDSLYACNFHKTDFVIYLVYPMFLLLASALYAIGVREERRNLKEAKYILICSWICVFVWGAWLAVYFVQPREFLDPAVAIGMLVNATVKLAVIYIPKTHMMATLKYDVNKTTHDQYTMKADSDFFFERPFSLPGTLKTSYSDKTYSRTYSTFES